LILWASVLSIQPSWVRVFSAHSLGYKIVTGFGYSIYPIGGIALFAYQFTAIFCTAKYRRSFQAWTAVEPNVWDRLDPSFDDF